MVLGLAGPWLAAETWAQTKALVACLPTLGRLGVRFSQPVNRHVRVNLSGIETRVTQQRLQTPQVRAAFHHQCRCRVT